MWPLSKQFPHRIATCFKNFPREDWLQLLITGVGLGLRRRNTCTVITKRAIRVVRRTPCNFVIYKSSLRVTERQSLFSFCSSSSCSVPWCDGGARVERKATEAEESLFVAALHRMNQNIPGLKTEIESFNQRLGVSPPGVPTDMISYPALVFVLLCFMYETFVIIPCVLFLLVALISLRFEINLGVTSQTRSGGLLLKSTGHIWLSTQVSV